MRYAHTQEPGRLFGAVLTTTGASPCTLEDDWDLALVDRGPDPTPWLAGLSPQGEEVHVPVVSAVPGWDLLANEATLWAILEHSLGRRFAERIAPQTYLLAHEPDRQLLLERHQADWSYLLKQPGARAGQGIQLFRDPHALLEAGGVLAQRLVPDQLIISHHRTKVRVYVVVERFQKRITAWLHELGHIIYAPGVWQHDPTDRDAVLTSMTPETVALPGPHTLEELWAYDTELPFVPIWARRRLSDAVGATLQAALDVACREPAADGYRYAQLFAADLLLTDGGRAKVLGFQRGADMGARSLADAQLKAKVLTDYLRLSRLMDGGHGSWRPVADATIPHV